METVNKVLKTQDLELFKPIQGNRVPNIAHVKRLAKSIEANGILQNPIIINANWEVVDGQHRLLAAKMAKSAIYFIQVEDYNLAEVQVLNLNQKNWSKKDFLDAYADMGVESYVRLRDFMKSNPAFTISSAIAICSNSTGVKSHSFNDGNWTAQDFSLSQSFVDSLIEVKPYYKGFARQTFIRTMMYLSRNQNFDFDKFLQKLSMQSSKMVDCTTVEGYKCLIEEIYNYKNRNKVNLRY